MILLCGILTQKNYVIEIRRMEESINMTTSQPSLVGSLTNRMVEMIIIEINKREMQTKVQDKIIHPLMYMIYKQLYPYIYTFIILFFLMFIMLCILLVCFFNYLKK